MAPIPAFVWAWPDGPVGEAPWRPQTTCVGLVHTGTSGWKPKATVGLLQCRENLAQLVKGKLFTLLNSLPWNTHGIAA